MDPGQSYVERAPVPALADLVRAVWIQRTDARPYLQRNLPTGGAELHCPIGSVPRLVGPLTAASVEFLDAARRSWAVVHPWGSGRVYPNFPDPDLADWAGAYHGGNYARLARVKRSYDPGRLPRFDQSV